MSKVIVVGVDGSANAGVALEWALDEAERRNCRVRAVLVWSFLGESSGNVAMGTTEEDARAMLDEAIAASAGDRGDLIDPVTVCDLAVDGLLSQLDDAELLVVGHRGRGKIKSLLLGSTSRTVIERSTVPVVVVPLPS